MSVRALAAAFLAAWACGCAWIDPPTVTSSLLEAKGSSSDSAPGATASGGLDTIGDAAAVPNEDAGPLVPVPPAPDAGSAVAIAAGYEHTCVATSTGAAYCWGANGSGQLGDGTTTDWPIAIAVTGLSGVTAVAAGAAHSCALSSNGTVSTVSCWGKNDHGQLGNGTTTDSTVPVVVQGLHGSVTAIASGASHMCALTSEGVACWGANAGGQLGNGATMDSSTAVQVQQLGVATAVAAGGEHSCAVVAGAMSCWGWNAYGQIGDGTTVNRPFATAVPSLTSGVTAISAGAANTCAVVGAAVRCWGYGQYGQIGDGATTNAGVPTSVDGLGSGQLGVSTGCMFACGLSAKGGVTCWGDDQSGQIGDDDPALLDKNVPTAVVGIASGATAIATGTAHACAIVGGVVQCWGWDVSGQLGNDFEADSATPVPVLGL